MQTDFDYRQFAVLYVDDEEKSLKLFARAFGETFRTLTAASAKAGARILEENKGQVAILMTDQQMPGEKGVWLLERARQFQPQIIRILVTAYADMDAVIQAVNSGAIYKYVTKPWDPVRLEHTLKRGLEFFIVQRERDQLLKEKMSVLHNMMVAERVVSLGNLAAGLSHHIRNALVAVKTFLDLAPAKMQEEKGDPDRLHNREFWHDYYESVQGQIHKILGMLTELGSASENLSCDIRDEVRVHEVLEEVIAGLEDSLTASGIRVLNQIPDSLPALRADRKKFVRLFELMLRDEIVSLPAASTVSFSAKLVSDKAEAPQEIEVRVQDNGPGLPKESLRWLFDPFVVRNGSPALFGINLMECYFIVHYHGGGMRAHSEDGQGTGFTLRLPLGRNPAPRINESPEFLQKVVLNQTFWEKFSAE